MPADNGTYTFFTSVTPTKVLTVDTKSPDRPEGRRDRDRHVGRGGVSLTG